MRRMNPELPVLDLEGQKFIYVWNRDLNTYDVNGIQIQMPKFLQNWIKDFDFNNWEFPEGKFPYLPNKILVKNMTQVFNEEEYKNDYIVNIFKYNNSPNFYFITELYNTDGDQLYNIVYEVSFDEQSVNENNTCGIDSYEFRNLSGAASYNDISRIESKLYDKLDKLEIANVIYGTDSSIHNNRYDQIALHYSWSPTQANSIVQRNKESVIFAKDPVTQNTITARYALTTQAFVNNKFPNENNVVYDAQFVSDTVVANNIEPGRYAIVLTDTKSDTDTIQICEFNFTLQAKNSSVYSPKCIDYDDNTVVLECDYSYSARTFTIWLMWPENGTGPYTNYHVDMHKI